MYHAARSRSFPFQAEAIDAGSLSVSDFAGVVPVVVARMVVPMAVAGSRWVLAASWFLRA